MENWQGTNRQGCDNVRLKAEPAWRSWQSRRASVRVVAMCDSGHNLVMGGVERFDGWETRVCCRRAQVRGYVHVTLL